MSDPARVVTRARRVLGVRREALDLATLQAQVCDARSGAVASFLGTVRSPDAGATVAWIDYEGYDAMIDREAERIADELEAEGPLLGLALVHRLGRCRPGEASIAIVACSAHRDAAFAACREALERAKARLPVWKRQHEPGGARWLPGRTVPGATLE